MSVEHAINRSAQNIKALKFVIETISEKISPETWNGRQSATNEETKNKYLLLLAKFGILTEEHPDMIPFFADAFNKLTLEEQIKVAQMVALESEK
jgi:hypothetical protein